MLTKHFTSVELSKYVRTTTNSSYERKRFVPQKSGIVRNAGAMPRNQPRQPSSRQIVRSVGTRPTYLRRGHRFVARRARPDACPGRIKCGVSDGRNGRQSAPLRRDERRDRPAWPRDALGLLPVGVRREQWPPPRRGRRSVGRDRRRHGRCREETRGGATPRRARRGGSGVAPATAARRLRGVGVRRRRRMSAT